MTRPTCTTCATCAAFNLNAGDCRRRSPTVVADKSGPWTIWPSVDHNEWCLEHVPLPLASNQLVQKPGGSKS